MSHVQPSFAARFREGHCISRSEYRITFAGPDILAYHWTSYDECGVRPTAYAASGVLRLSTLGPVFPSDRPWEDPGHLGLSSLLCEAELETVAVEAERAVVATQDTCCCEYSAEPDSLGWRIERTVGRWRLTATLAKGAGQYCHDEDFRPPVALPAGVVGHDLLPAPLAHLRRAIDARSRNQTTTDTAILDLFCSPRAADVCLAITSEGLSEVATRPDVPRVGPPLMNPTDLGRRTTVVMVQWALSNYVEKWTKAFGEFLVSDR